MKAIKIIAAFIITAVFSTVAYAQPGGGPPPEKREQIESMKIAFLTNKLSLTPEEAQQFWPVYNQFQDELHKLRENHRKERRDAKDEFETMKDAEVEKIVDNEIAFRQNELDILKKYHSQFKSVLPVKKVAKLYRAEEDFKRELLKKIQDRKPGERRGR